jgi:hypothetical protein
MTSGKHGFLDHRVSWVDPLTVAGSVFAVLVILEWSALNGSVSGRAVFVVERQIDAEQRIGLLTVLPNERVFHRSELWPPGFRD